MDETRENKEQKKKKLANKNPCIVNAPVQVKASKEVLVSIGQGDGDTR